MDFTTICRADSPRDKYFFTLYGGDDFLQQKYEEWKESFPFDDQLLYLSYQVEQGKVSFLCLLNKSTYLTNQHIYNSLKKQTNIFNKSTYLQFIEETNHHIYNL